MNLPHFNNPPSLLKATYHINTPMFAAGANTQDAELTPTSFKGVMRFWWRALNWSQIRMKAQSDAEALINLHKQESKLFGVAVNDNRVGQGQGACLISSLSLASQKKWDYHSRKDGINYLMGQGLYKNGLTREAIAPNQEFSIEFTVVPEYHDAIVDVLKLIGLLGGLGSRSRHGLGSVTLKSLAGKTAQQKDYKPAAIDIENAATTLTQLLQNYQCRDNNQLPPISAFYAGTRIDVIHTTENDALALLDTVGKEQQLYRSYGGNGKVNGQPSERNFVEDHDLMIDISDRKFKGSPSQPKRSVFGLPHNYFYSSSKLKVDVDSSTGRRASPLFFHVHHTSSGYQLISCLLKSKFLPDDARIEFSTNRKSAEVNPDWQVIIDFMNRPKFNNKETL